MFPDFHYLFKGLFGIDLPFLSVFKTFGFLVALSFLAGAWVLRKELLRKKQLGLFEPERVDKQDKKTGKMVRHILYPHDRVVDIIFIAAITGFAGAKIFNAFETWDSFIADPLGNLISPAGLTFYGGLICATFALYIYSRKKKFSFKHLCDAAAPALILAYGLGRLGCQLAGDGDWGIYNSAYISQADGTLTEATPARFDSVVKANESYFNYNLNQHKRVEHRYVPAGLVPRWLIAQNYPHNVNHDGVILQGDDGEYNTVLPVAVFPTPIYETIACVLLFFFLWAIRRRIDVPLRMFGIYLILNGLERFFVEKIRVNYKYEWFFNLTQAEIISSALVIAGILLLVFCRKRQEPVEGIAANN